MAGTDAGDLYDLANELLEAAVVVLDGLPTLDPSLDGAPDRRFVSPGTPALDCCDQLTVHVAAVSDAPLPPGGLAAGKRKPGSLNHVSLVATITRCIPVPDAQGTPPPEGQLQAAAGQQDADAWVLWNDLEAMWRADDLFAGCREVFWDGLRPVGPAGGCGGWTLALRVSLEGYET